MEQADRKSEQLEGQIHVDKFIVTRHTVDLGNLIWHREI